MSNDLPEELQTSYEALVYLFQSTLAPADAEDALADLEMLTAPLRAAEGYVASYTISDMPVPVWDIDEKHEHMVAVHQHEKRGFPPSLLDLVLQAHEKTKEQQA